MNVRITLKQNFKLPIEILNREKKIESSDDLESQFYSKKKREDK
jgi:hypothetical protein